MVRQYVTGRMMGAFILVTVCLAGAVGVMFPPHIYPIAAVIGALVLAMMIYSPISSLLIYLVFFLAWPQEWAPYFNYLPGFTERIIGIMAIGSLVISMLVRQRFSFYMGRPGYAFVLMIAAFTLSAFTAYYLTEVKETLIEMLRLLTVFVLIANICDTPRKLRAVVWLYFAAVGIMSIISVVNYYNGIVWYRMGIMRALGLGGSYGDPNSHASTITYALPVMFYYIKGSRHKIEKAILTTLGLIGCWNIILTGSRTAMVGVLFVLGVVIWRSERKLMYILAAVVLMAVAVIAMPDQYKERFISTADLTSETAASESARGRIEGLQHGLLLFLKSPLTGVGAGCYAIARGSEFGIYFSSHNMLGELIAETGFIGLTAFGFFAWSIFVSIKRARENLHGRLDDDPDAQFLYGLTEGLYVSFMLLFLLGLAAHNLYRYNWYFYAALVTVVVRVMPTAAVGDGALSGSDKKSVVEEVKE